MTLLPEDACPECREYNVGQYAYDEGHGPGSEFDCPGCGVRLSVIREVDNGWQMWLEFATVPGRGR